MTTKTKRADGENLLNLAVLIGTVRAEPNRRPLPSGDWLLSFDVRVPAAEGRRQSIPVSWIGPEAKLPQLSAEAETMVVGEVRRRFYRVGGSLGSQVDVRALKIVKGGKGARRRVLASLL